MSEPRPTHGLGRAAAAALLLGLLLAGLATPVLSLLFEADAATCCSGGRCCCRKDEGPRPEGPCLTTGCGCERPETSTAAAPLRLEGLLPGSALLLGPRCAWRAFLAGAESPRPRPDEPLVPPPRRLLPTA